MIPRRQHLLFLGLALFLAAPSSALACNIPVFRYALERWIPDHYRVLLFHKGPLTGTDKKVADQLQEYLLDANCPANCTIELVDVAEKLDAELEQVWQTQKNATLPWVVVRYPKTARTAPRNLFEGGLDAAKMKALLDSPARQELARRLLRGTSAVWVFLESGDEQKDAAKASWLKAHLKKLEKELKLPELTATPKDKLLVANLQLKIEFSVLRLSRKNVEEAMLIQMLLGTEEDLDSCQEPIVFPVFGRGLVLYALLGKGINEGTVTKAARFILGPCSCEVKEQNPGVDLLTAIDWEGGLTRRVVPTPELPPLTGLAPPTASAPDHDEVLESPAIMSQGMNLVPAFAILISVALVGTLIILFWKGH